MARQRGHQHVLHQRALARAGDAGDDDKRCSGNSTVTSFRLCSVARSQDELRGCWLDQALEAHAHVLAPAEVGAGERVGRAHLLGRAVKDDVAALVAGGWGPCR